MIKLKHSNDIISGSLLKEKVYINNEQTAKIAHGEEKELPLPYEDSVIQIKQFGSKSNTLVINDGDFVEIKYPPRMLWGFLFTLMLFTATSPLNITNSPIYFIVILVYYLVTAKVLNVFKLTKKNDRNSTLSK